MILSGTGLKLGGAILTMVSPLLHALHSLLLDVGLSAAYSGTIDQGVRTVTNAFNTYDTNERLKMNLRAAEASAEAAKVENRDLNAYISELVAANNSLKTENRHLEHCFDTSKRELNRALARTTTSDEQELQSELQSLRQQLEEAQRNFAAEEICHKSAVTEAYDLRDEVERQKAQLKTFMYWENKMAREFAQQKTKADQADLKLREKEEAVRLAADQARSLATKLQKVATPHWEYE